MEIIDDSFSGKSPNFTIACFQQRVAKSLGCLRHLVLMHLVATNVAVWLKLLLWETSSEWLRQNHVEQAGQTIWPPKGFNFTTHIIDDKGEHKVFCKCACIPVHGCEWWWIKSPFNETGMDTLQEREHKKPKKVWMHPLTTPCKHDVPLERG